MTTIKLKIQDLNTSPLLIRDYLKGKDNLSFLFESEMSEAGLLQSLESKMENYSHRELLSKVIDFNYPNKNNIDLKEVENIEALRSDGYAIATAHQPNLFLGPFYTITKAISTISIANRLNNIQTNKRIVPVFVIGSEDHDKEEILETNLFGKNYRWNTAQSGSVGSMIVDEDLVGVLNAFMTTFGDSENARRLKNIFSDAYQIGHTITFATASILRSLFAKHGLIVLDINIPEVKHEMKTIFLKDLQENEARNATESTITYLLNNYHVQASPLDINTFVYENGERIKIKKASKEVLELLNADPACFSPSVILRPLMQQLVLPSIAYVGGAAEVCYWLELKELFKANKIHFPTVVLRDIYSVLDEKSWKRWQAAGLEAIDFKMSEEEIKKKIVGITYDLEHLKSSSIQSLKQVFESLENVIMGLDASLVGTVKKEESNSAKSMQTIFSKLTKSMKLKEEANILSLLKVKSKIYNEKGLLERQENFSSYYIKYGDLWLSEMIEKLDPLQGEWTINIR
jgi:bacillithiol biosynthesis cysteine-adding enzyme BshC